MSPPAIVFLIVLVAILGTIALEIIERNRM
jgi:hypothetical protein